MKDAQLILVFRADPVICGHSTEGRNLAENAKRAGFQHVHIVTYDEQVLKKSQLPLKNESQDYSAGITVHRPPPTGDYKILDGRIIHAMSGTILDLLRDIKGPVVVMDLYLVPHGRIVMDAVRIARKFRAVNDIVTIAEAVGSDITSQISISLEKRQYGAAQYILENFLEHDILLAVSLYTKNLILDLVERLDRHCSTDYSSQISHRCKISYPPIDVLPYQSLCLYTEESKHFLEKHRVTHDGFLLFLSRITESKGVVEMIQGYLCSQYYKNREKPLIICGKGPYLKPLQQVFPPTTWIRYIENVNDLEKAFFFYHCHAYLFPSKPTDTFVETFGIVLAEKMLTGGKGLILSTDTGGIPEATGPWRLLLRAGSARSITENLDSCRCMTEKERCRFAQEGQRYAMKFEAQKIFGKILTHVHGELQRRIIT